MALTGNQKAYRYALSNVALSGATRSGYVSGLVFISVGGLPQRVQIDSLEIVDELNETPNTCRFRLIGPTSGVATGAEVKITLGSRNNSPLFAGHVLSTAQSYWQKPENTRTDVSCVDFTWMFNFPKVTKRYANLSASTIVQDLLATYAAPNTIGGAYVAAGLPTIPEITFTNEDLGDALSRTANRIGAYWYVDYSKQVHFFFTDAGPGPAALVPTHPSLADVRTDTDRSQALTRVYVEGRGSTLLSAVAIGDTMLPLEAVDMFAALPDVFVKASFQGSEGGAQHLSYTGVVAGGRGSLVGPGIGPSAAPTLALVTGAGLGAGVYQYAVTFTTAAGESLPSPLAAITTGVLTAPTAAPVPGLPTAGTGPDAGPHQYAVTWTTAAGETTPGPLSADVTTGALPPPPAAPHFLGAGGSGAQAVGTYRYAFNFVTATGETIPGPTALVAHGVAGTADFFDRIVPGPAGTTARRIYRTTVGPGPQLKLLATLADNTTTTYTDALADAALGVNAPTTTTAPGQVVPLSGIPLGGSSVTGRKIYRTAAGGAQLKLVATLADNTTTTYTDTTTDAGLGANAPTTSTAVAAQVVVSNIPLGGTLVTGRKIYRTLVNGAALKLQSTLANNTVTTLTDSTPDGSLGAALPGSDTSGLLQPDGQVVAGATSLLVAGTGAFEAGGGWAVIGNGEQFIRYTGITGSALTGIPPSGLGSITAAIAYNSTATAAPMLTGIPASGARSIATALSAGDEIYLVVQVDDLARQSYLSGWMGGTGVREEWVQDRRLSIGEARARGQATLTERVLDQIRVSYTCRDVQTRSGKDITVNLPAPTNLSGTFKIQHVVINNFRPYPNQYPTFTVQASSSRFSFEDLLRLVSRDVAR